jgi:type IV pilus assembly protein PilQ
MDRRRKGLGGRVAKLGFGFVPTAILSGSWVGAVAPATRPAVDSPAQLMVAPARKLVSNLWVDTDLRQVVQDISSQTDTVIVCDQTVQGIVSMSVKDMSIEECLERVCAAGSCAFVKIKDYYVVGKAEPGSPLFQRMAEPQRVKLSHVLPEQVRTLLHPSMAPYVTFDKVGGTVVVTAPEPLSQRVLDAVRIMDQPNLQVAIDAIVFELTEEGSKQLALDWQYRQDHVAMRSDNLIGTIAYGSGSDLGTYVDLTLRAIVETRKGQVLANPRVLVVNNTEAEIFVGQEKYFSLLSGQASNPYYTLESIKAGVTLKVLPYIGENGQITLTLEPEVSDVVADLDRNTRTESQNGVSNALPVVTRRHARTVINIEDGQTILIGGLLREQHRSIIDKVPVMGDIPVIGAAFRNIRREKLQQEVVILITAHVVDPARAGVGKLTSRLEPRYVSPLDAMAAPPHQQAERK